MNGTPGTAIGRLDRASLNPVDRRFGEVVVRAVANGWIINCYGDEFVFHAWNEVVEKLEEIFGIEK